MKNFAVDWFSHKHAVFQLDLRFKFKISYFWALFMKRFVENPCAFSFYGVEILSESSGIISVGNPLTNITKSRWMVERNEKCFADD